MLVLHRVFLPLAIASNSDRRISCKEQDLKIIWRVDPLPGNGPYIRSRGTLHVRDDVTQRYKMGCKRCSLRFRSESISLDGPT
jgi:hypothetical protein